MNDSSPSRNTEFRVKLGLAILVAAQLAGYTWLANLSTYYDLTDESISNVARPILTIVALLMALFVASIASLALAIRLQPTYRLVIGIVAIALAFRGIVLFSHPIQEVDLYRYMWDGNVTVQGVSPYRFPPVAVSNALKSDQKTKRQEFNNQELSKLVDSLRRQPSLARVLSHVHYSELPTVYPPTSQVVFACSDLVTPDDASFYQRIVVMKFVITVFDVGILLLLIWLLRVLDLHPGWSIVYGWSPLAIKEFANSGHLDTIAVFLMMASILVAVRNTERIHIQSHLSGLLLGLGVGAKLFPVVLAPLLLVFSFRRCGWTGGLRWASTFVVAAGLSLWPMFRPTQIASETNADSLSGLKTFLQYWEINDLAFMAIEENVRPDGAIQGQPELWFVVTPNQFRQSLTANVSSVSGIDPSKIPFLMTRGMTTLLFGLIVLWLIRRTWNDPSRVLESSFLVLAWFWLLSPTQNPWYWTWALALAPFATNRVWLCVGGLTLIYYTRFWFVYHTTTINWLPNYKGVTIFDFIVVWIEFLPFYLALVASCVWTRTRRFKDPSVQT